MSKSRLFSIKSKNFREHDVNLIGSAAVANANYEHHLYTIEGLGGNVDARTYYAKVRNCSTRCILLTMTPVSPVCCYAYNSSVL